MIKRVKITVQLCTERYRVVDDTIIEERDETARATHIYKMHGKDVTSLVYLTWLSSFITGSQLLHSKINAVPDAMPMK